MRKSLHLGSADARRVGKLLGEYQTFLKSVIECHTLADGTTNRPDYQVIVGDARRKWRQAEDAVSLLTGNAKPVPSIELKSARASLSKSSTAAARPAKEKGQ